MRELTCSEVKLEYLRSHPQISGEDIKAIDKKSGHSRKRRLIITFCITALCTTVYSLFCVPESFFYCLLCIAVVFALLIPCIRNRKIYACRAVVTRKRERWARVGATKIPPVMPYSETESPDPTLSKVQLCYFFKSYYFCTVDINDEIFENVCCYEKDFDNIKIGDTVIIGGNTGIPIVYAPDK